VIVAVMRYAATIYARDHPLTARPGSGGDTVNFTAQGRGHTALPGPGAMLALAPKRRPRLSVVLAHDDSGQGDPRGVAVCL